MRWLIGPIVASVLAGIVFLGTSVSQHRLNSAEGSTDLSWPFESGTTWVICVGYYAPNVPTHFPYPVFDLMVDGNGPVNTGCPGGSDQTPNTTAGKKVIASADGTVWSASGSIVCVNITGTTKSYRVAHISPTIAAGARVTKGSTQLGTVQGQNADNNNVSHIHFELYAAANCKGGDTPFSASGGGLDIEGKGYLVPAGTAPQGGWYIKTKVNHNGCPPNCNTATATDVPNPDAYSCSQAGKVDFEVFKDGTNLSSGTIAGMRFTTTGGYTWRVGDWNTGTYNGKYPPKPYTSQGTHWAWLGESQGAGRIDFPKGPASNFSLLVSDFTPVQVDAYDAQNRLLATAGPSASNIGTGRMTELKIGRASRDMAYVVVHDNGNFFLIDQVCTDAPGTPDTINRIVNKTYPMQTGGRAQDSFFVNLVNGAKHFLHFFLGPYFSDVDLNITRPNGSVVSASDPGVIIDKTANSVDISVDDAAVGQWHYEIVANQLEPGGEDISLTVDDETFIVETPDSTAPVTTASLVPPSPNGRRGWYNSDVTVTLGATDPDPGDGSTPSGVASTQYQLNGGGFQSYTGPFTVSNESVDNVVEFFSRDVAGNIEATKNVHFKLDKTPPTVGIGAGGLDGLAWDQAHLQRGVLTNSNTLALTGSANDNLCLWEVRLIDADTSRVLASQQPVGANVFPPLPPSSLAYSLNAALHTGINNIDVLAEDCAGWSSAIRMQVVYVIPGAFDPRPVGFWYSALKSKTYTLPQMMTLVSYINIVSDVWGSDTTRNRYGVLSVPGALATVFPGNPELQHRMQGELLGDWLDLVSGRLAVKRAANVSKINGWPQVMDDIGGNPLTFALKIPLEIEEKVQPAQPTDAITTIARDLAEGMNDRESRFMR